MPAPCVHKRLRHLHLGDLIVTGGATATRTLDWIRRNTPDDAHAFLTDVTSGYGVLGLMGPRSRELLAQVTGSDISNRAFPFLASREINIGYATVRATRITYVGELGWAISVTRVVPNIGPRITVLNTKGETLARIGHLGYGLEVGQFLAPHGLCLDSNGNIYMGEVARTQVSHHENQEPPDQIRAFQKLSKV